jgi:phospholipase/lecithinase/hemolysin
MNVVDLQTVAQWLRVLVLVALLSVSVAPSALAQDFNRVIVFGDSLSDSGNYFIAFHAISHQPFVPIPDAPYAIGGHHFSNGATWAERLTTALHKPTSGNPAFRSPGVFTNYAVGRSRARSGAPVFSTFDLSTQVSQFLSDFGRAPFDDLYVVWIGSNDLNDALNALTSDPSGVTSGAIIQEAIAATAANIGALHAQGARTFLVPNLPNFAITPVVRALGPGAEFAATQLTDAYNGGLDQALLGLAALPGIHFIRLDINALFAEIVADPAAAGLTDVADACLTFGVIGRAICSTPNRFLFWDGIHPTTVAHEIIADAALEALTHP